MKILVSGIGSIGQRHVRNLRSLGAGGIVTCDPHGTADEADFAAALANAKPDVVFICCPTMLHVPQALEAARAGAQLFIEKPLSHGMEGVEELRRDVASRGLICMVGCNMRFHHGPATAKKLLDEGAIGEAKSATVYTGSYLPHWRPRQDYKKSYSADPAQGGAILDCIHEIDLALWYFGPAALEHATKESAAAIGLPQVEGTADLDLKHANGTRCRVHLSFVEPAYRRFCSIEGERGSIEWDFGKKAVEVRALDGDVIGSYPEPAGYDVNQMYVDELKHFLACVEGKRTPSGNLAEAAMALDLALKAKNS